MDKQMKEYTLKEGEYHPVADSAMKWFKTWKLNDPKRYAITSEAIASTALSGNRGAELCFSTLQRLEKGEPVSDRYLLALCWMLRDLEDKQKVGNYQMKEIIINIYENRTEFDFREVPFIQIVGIFLIIVFRKTIVFDSPVKYKKCDFLKKFWK